MTISLTSPKWLAVLLLLALPAYAQTTTISGTSIGSGSITCGSPTSQCATPTFAPVSGGTFNTGISSAVSSATSGASIYITLDGTTPGSSSTVTLAGAGFPILGCTGGTSYTTTPTLFAALNAASPGAVICAENLTFTIGSTEGISATGSSSSFITLYCLSGQCILTGTGSGPMVQVFNASTTAHYLRIIGFNANGQNDFSECFASNGGAHIDFWWDAAYNCGGAGFYANNADYITYEHDIAFHNGYNTGDSSGFAIHSNATLDSYTGFHNIIAYNWSGGNFDNGPHTDGNGFIDDDGGESVPTNDPATLFIGNTSVGNGGRGFALDNASNVWVVNNSSYSNGLDQVQSSANGELTLNSCANCNIINNEVQSYNSHNPVVFTGTLSSITCTSNIYFGGTNSLSGFCASGMTSQNPDYSNPTAVASPVIVNGNSGQYANIQSPAIGWLTNLWTATPATGVNPLTLVTGNLESDMTNFSGSDCIGVTRPTASTAIGACQDDFGTLLLTGQVPYLTQYTINAIAVKAGMSNSAQASASYTLTIP